MCRFFLSKRERETLVLVFVSRVAVSVKVPKRAQMVVKCYWYSLTIGVMIASSIGCRNRRLNGIRIIQLSKQTKMFMSKS